jgi:hypothetical protein
MLKWLTDWLSGKTPDTNDIQVNPFPATEKAPEPVAVVSTAAPAAKKAAKPKAEKKPAAKKTADKKPAKAPKADKKPATKKKKQA